MGVLNVTPDSFSDGGDFAEPEAATDHAWRMIDEGANVIDVGAESTRPGAKPLAPDEEWRRLEPVLRRLQRTDLRAALSIDTRHPEVMLRAADMGANIINDVAGGAPDEVLGRLAAYPRMQYIAMHMHASPETMQNVPLKGAHAVTTVDLFFADAAARLQAAGFPDERIWLDPGVGFGKDDAGNVQLIQASGDWSKRYQLCVGISRKGFIGRALGIEAPKDRDAPSKMLELGLAMAGVQMIRTHDVKGLKNVLTLLKEGD